MKRSLLLAWLMLLILARLGSAQDSPQTERSLVFKGNRVFSQQELRDVTSECLANARSKDAYLDYCLWKLKLFLSSKGYLHARVGTPSEQQSDPTPQLVVPIDEGPMFRLGKINIEGSTLFSPSRLLEMLALNPGDVANAESLEAWALEKLAKLYGNLGYMRYTAELEPIYHIEPGAREGTVDFKVDIDEGEAFTIRSIKFEGNGKVSEYELLKQMLVRKGEIFNRQLFDESLKRISENGQFETIDVDKDVDYKWKNQNPRLDLIIHLRKKP